MPEFQLNGKTDATFADLDLFTQGYIEAMFWTETAHGYYMADWHSDETQEAIREGQADGTLPEDAGFPELHPSALADIIAQCTAFQNEAGALLSLAYDREGYGDPSQAGHDFWLTRNGHGTGFWDRSELDAGDLGDLLSFAAKGYGEPQVWFADHTEHGDAPFVYHD